jgi:hypothetical protein
MQGLSFTKALLSTTNMQVIAVYKSNAHYFSRQFNKTVTLSQTGPLEHVIKGERAHVIQIRFGPPIKEEEGPNSIPVGPLHRVFANAISPTFVQFYEDNAEWMEKSYGKNPHEWPSSIWNFGRVVRNAISHGGCINIDDKTAPTVTWYHLAYGPAQNKQLIIGTDFLFADLMILMFEMSDELDRLGRPI